MDYDLPTQTLAVSCATLAVTDRLRIDTKLLDFINALVHDFDARNNQTMKIVLAGSGGKNTLFITCWPMSWMSLFPLPLATLVIVTGLSISIHAISDHTSYVCFRYDTEPEGIAYSHTSPSAHRDDSQTRKSVTSREVKAIFI